MVSADYGNGKGPSSTIVGSKSAAKEKWLVEAVRERFDMYKQSSNSSTLDELYVLIGSLKVLGFEGAYQSMRSELAELVKH